MFMAEYHTVCRVSEVKEGDGKTVIVGKKLIALFLHNGQYYAIDDCCPHMGASLSAGWVENGVVTCPWHAWHFRLEDGAWMDNRRIRIGCFPVRVVGDDIQVQVESTPPEQVAHP